MEGAFVIKEEVRKSINSLRHGNALCVDKISTELIAQDEMDIGKNN